MDDKAALEKLQRGEVVDQSTLKRLSHQRLIETSDVTNFQSSERELLFISITPTGRKLLEGN